MPEIYMLNPEAYDERNNRFIESGSFLYRYEHSLLSVSKWEAKTHRPFLDEQEKSIDDWIFYIQCMSLDSISLDQCFCVYADHFGEILEYIDDLQTATTFEESPSTPLHPMITNEVIYYWMTKFHIPFECEKWNFNRLMTLIRVIGETENPRQMSREEIFRQNTELNRARKAALKAGKL